MRTPATASRLVSIGLWAVGFVAAFLLLSQWQTGVHNDFTQNVWLPSRLLFEGVNPYNPSPAVVNDALGPYSSAFTSFNGGAYYFFIYPVWVALALSPFAALPLVTATTVWRAMNLLLLLWSVGVVLRTANPAFRSRRAVAVAALVLTLFLSVIFRESIVTLYSGQFSILELALLTAVWVRFARNDEGRRTKDGRQEVARQLTFVLRPPSFVDILTGLALAMLATKPQATGLVVLLFLVWAASRRRWIIPVSTALWFGILMLGPLIFYPGSLGDWLSVAFGGRGQATSQSRVSASVWGLCYQWVGTWLPSVWVPLALLLSLAGVLFLVPHWLRDFSDRTSLVPLSLPLTICINSLVSPYLLGYEQVLLLMPAAMLLAKVGLPGDNDDASEVARKRKRLRLAIYMWLGILPFLIVILQSALPMEYPLIIQSATMLALCTLPGSAWKVKGGQWHMFGGRLISAGSGR